MLDREDGNKISMRESQNDAWNMVDGRVDELRKLQRSLLAKVRLHESCSPHRSKSPIDTIGGGISAEIDSIRTCLNLYTDGFSDNSELLKSQLLGESPVPVSTPEKRSS